MSEAEKAKYGDISSVHNWTVSGRQEPTCGKDGYIDYICMVDHCGTTFRHTLPAAGQQVADKPADLLFHRVRVHFFFFLGVVCAFGAGTTGSGTAPGRVKPRQII